METPEVAAPEGTYLFDNRAGLRALLAGRGAELELGRRLPRLLRGAGLVDVGADAYVPISLPGVARMEEANVQQVRDDMIAGGYASAEEVDAHLAAVRGGRLELATPPMVSAWGRKP